jgi:glutathione peroxidase
MKLIHLLLLLFATVGIMSESTKSFYDFTMKNIQGKDVPLNQYKGKALLVVNVASKCGYTPQYDGLEALYKKYKDKGLVVIGFPANNFGSQEPGSNDEIAKFCKTNYGVTFDMMSKISVKGSDQNPLYQYLTSEAPEKGDVKWNFEKFLVSKNGKVVGRFASGISPDSKELAQSIEKALQ